MFIVLNMLMYWLQNGIPLKTILILISFMKFTLFQACLDSYKYDQNTNFFTWLARNSQMGNAIDGGTVVMVSQLLKRNISIILVDNIWNCRDAPTDITFIYGSDNKFIPAEVSRSMFVLLSMFIVKILHFLFS